MCRIPEQPWRVEAPDEDQMVFVTLLQHRSCDRNLTKDAWPRAGAQIR